MKCPNCLTNPPLIHASLGVIPCAPCQKKTHKRPNSQIEFTTEDIKESRKAYYDDVLQPHRKGQLSKEWVEINGKKAASDRGFTDKEIAKAKYVWRGMDGVTYYKEGK